MGEGRERELLRSQGCRRGIVKYEKRKVFQKNKREYQEGNRQKTYICEIKRSKKDEQHIKSNQERKKKEKHSAKIVAKCFVGVQKIKKIYERL